MEILSMLTGQCMTSIKNDEYLEDGMLYCKKCHGKRLFVAEDGFKVRCLCSCQREEVDRLEAIKTAKENVEKFKELQSASLIGNRYKNVSFLTTNIDRDATFINAYNRCRKFCDAWEEVLLHGYGMYLWGASGTGKTHLMACMANELTKKLIPCVFTNFMEISKSIKDIFKNNALSESEYVDKLANVPFLFLDDFGTEKVKNNGEDNWLQEKIYDIINKRYNAQKPTIFSSNWKMRELVENRGIMQKTIDRIFEMSSAVIEVKGESYRAENINKEIPF